MTHDGKLSPVECSQLAASGETTGFGVFLDIARREIENLRIDLENTDPAKPSEVLANHAIVHGAQKYWNNVLQAVKVAVEHSRRVPDRELTEAEKIELRDAGILDARVPSND